MADLIRLRPAMGTFMKIHVQADDAHAQAAVTEAFDRAMELEFRFSKFNPESEIYQPADVTSPEFKRLMALVHEIESASLGAFHSRRQNQLDLSGIAKGFIVDEICGFLNERLPGVGGSVNAGGDLRFLTEGENEIHVTFVPGRARILRTHARAFATSSFAEALHNPNSTTAYDLPPARGLNDQHTLSVEAPTCAIADALTKVGWFAPREVAGTCASRFDARIHVFTPDGEPQESIVA